MKSIHAGPAQSDQVVAPRPGSIATIARGREFSSASSADSAAFGARPNAPPYAILTVSFSSARIFRHACWMDLEGIVSKRIGSRYVSGRTRAWLKTKNPDFERCRTRCSSLSQW